MSDGHREEVLNVILAELLEKRGLEAAPERKRGEVGRRFPDVLVRYRGLSVVLEGKVGEDASAEREAEEDARRRVEEGLADLGVAVVYPKELRDMPFSEVAEAMKRGGLRFRVVSEEGVDVWGEGGVDELVNFLDRAVERLVREEAVEQAARALREAVERLADAFLVYRTSPGRLAEALGIEEVGNGEREQEVVRIACLTVVNAMMFQEILARGVPGVIPLLKFVGGRDPARDLIEHWKYIVREVNYQPIFHVARQVLMEVPASSRLFDALRFAAEKVREVVGERAALRHDLAGRVYHRLLSRAKYLGAYYTSVPAATLLAKLALRPDGWPLDWSDEGQIRRLRVGDLACGTGTLLMAAAEAVTDNYRWACAKRGKRPNLAELHRILMEEVLHGYDVLISALHLTASTLALRSPEVDFRGMNLYCMALGKTEWLGTTGIYLGSLEFLRGGGWAVGGLEATTVRVSPRGSPSRDLISRPALNLCMMNPPFTRSVGGNLLFGSMRERGQMQNRLRRLLLRSDPKGYASVQAGLGSVFTLLGHETLSPGGRLALVLPRAVLSGVSWRGIRRLLWDHYDLEYIVVSHHPGRWNFSENTDLSEVLLVARKRDRGEERGGTVACVNLWRNPGTAVEALSVARDLVRRTPSGGGSWEIRLGGNKVAEVVEVRWQEMETKSWMPYCAFARSELVHTALSLLRNGTLRIRGSGQVSLPLRPLGSLGQLGPDRRNVHNAFQPIPHRTPYPALWGHSSSKMVSMSLRPNAYLSPRNQVDNQTIQNLWKCSGRLLLAERLWPNTHRLAAALLERDVLSNVWWPFRFNGSDAAAKALVLWLNSSLGLLLLLAVREETRGGWIDFKKPHWENLPTLDVRSLPKSTLDALASAFDRLSASSLKPIRDLHCDPVRKAIDDSLSQALNLPDLSPIRTLLSTEPILTLTPLDTRTASG